MRISRIPESIPGQLLVSVLGSILILGAPGCNTFVGSGLDAPAGEASPFGVFLNSSSAKNDVLGSIRLPDGDSVFVFGRFGSSGFIEEVTGAALVDRDNQQASVNLKNGVVERAQSFDGSTLNIVYEELSLRRVKGRVDLFFAAVPEPDQNQTIEFDFDLEQAAAELAQMVREFLDYEISEEEPPPDPSGKAMLLDPLMAEFGKDAASSQLLVYYFGAFHVAAFAHIGFAIVEVMANLLPILMESVVALVHAVSRNVVVVVITPFMLLGEIMRFAVHHPISVVDVDVDVTIGFRDDDDDD